MTFEKLPGILPPPDCPFLLGQVNCTELPDINKKYSVSWNKAKLSFSFSIMLRQLLSFETILGVDPIDPSTTRTYIQSNIISNHDPSQRKPYEHHYYLHQGLSIKGVKVTSSRPIMNPSTWNLYEHPPRDYYPHKGLSIKGVKVTSSRPITNPSN